MTSGLWRRAKCVGQALVDDIEHPVLSDDDAAHIGKVLRARDAEQVCLVDGRGSWRIGEWRHGTVTGLSDIEHDAAPEAPVDIVFALVKGDRSEWAVQKLTELGADRITVVTSSAHGVVKWDAAKTEKNVARMQRVAREACMQSRRTRLPELQAVRTLRDIDRPFAVAHPGGLPVSDRTPAVAIGPEGGWSPSELDLAPETIDLGPTILRAETAAIAACVRLCALRDR